MFSTARRAAVVVLALAMAACGGSGGSGGEAEGEHGGDHETSGSVHEPVDGAQTATVTAVDLDFKPAELTLQAGKPTNVTIVNKGETLHDFTLEEADVHVNVEPGSEVETAVTIDEPGSYKAICTVAGHEDAGMVVDVTVE